MSKGYKRIMACLGMIGAFIAEFAIQVAVVAIIMILCIFIGYSGNPTEIIQDPNVNGIASVAIAGVSIAFFGIVYYLFKRYGIIGKAVPQQIIRAKGSYYVGIIILGVAVQAFGYGALNFIGIFAADTEVFRHYNEIMQSLDVTLSPFMLLYACFLAPVSEELIFRGVILDFGRTGFRAGVAVFLSALAFGIFHMNIIQGIYAAIFGIILGYVRLTRNSLLDSIITHMTINIAGVSIVPVVAALITMMMGEIASYALISVMGIIVIAMYFLHDKGFSKEKVQ